MIDFLGDAVGIATNDHVAKVMRRRYQDQRNKPNQYCNDMPNPGVRVTDNEVQAPCQPDRERQSKHDNQKAGMRLTDRQNGEHS